MSGINLDPELQAGYLSPLTDKEHATLGRIAVLWGQIESFIDFVVPAFCDLDHNALDKLGVFDKPMGNKANFLEAVSKRRSVPEVHAKVLKFTHHQGHKNSAKSCLPLNVGLACQQPYQDS
jgi:hypothetical protein